MADQALAERDRDFWSTRVAALATLAAADALAVVLPLPDGRYVAYAEHNVGQDRAWLDGPAQYLIWSAVKQRTVHRRAETEVPLRDGTIANSLAVAPIPWGDRIVGALVSLRCAETYEPTVGAPTEDLARLVGLELAVSSMLQLAAPDKTNDAELRRAIDDRRHAIALYELSRQALRPTASGRIAPLLADTLGYGLVGVWIERDGELHLSDGHGYEGQPGPVRADSDVMLERVLREGTTQRVARPASAPVWMGAAGEAIVTPFGGDAARGILVFGLPARPFSGADLTIAPSLAECVSLAQAQRAVRAPERAPELPPLAAAERSPLPAEPVARQPDRATVADPGTAHGADVEAARSTPPAAAMMPSAATTDAMPAPAARARRGWVLPLFLLALITGVVGVVLTEPLIFVLAGLLLLVAFWGWLA